MKLSSTFVLLCVLQTASVYGRSNKNSNKSNKSKSNKNDKSKYDKDDTGGKEPSAISKFLGNFRTVIDILKTGNATDLAQSTCDGVAKGFGIEDNMDCLCDARLEDGFNHITANLDCFTFTEDTCLETSGDDICGAVFLEAGIRGGLETAPGGYVSTCFGADIPEGLGFYEVCVEADFTATGLEYCSAMMNGDECFCAPCDHDFSILFDCSDIDLSPFPGFPLYGPKVDTCQQLNFQPSQ